MFTKLAAQLGRSFFFFVISGRALLKDLETQSLCQI